MGEIDGKGPLTSAACDPARSAPFVSPVRPLSVQIEMLADRPEFISTLAEWHHAEWAYLRPGDTLQARVSRLQSACEHREQPPTVFIASVGAQLVGSAMLLPYDMDTRLELSPWLGGVFTAPEFRGRGIGSMLSRHVVQYAAALGFSRLYLYTPNAENFYSRLGWSGVERIRYKDTDVTLMFQQCSDFAFPVNEAVK